MFNSAIAYIPFCSVVNLGIGSPGITSRRIGLGVVRFVMFSYVSLELCHPEPERSEWAKDLCILPHAAQTPTAHGRYVYVEREVPLNHGASDCSRRIAARGHIT